MVGIAVYMTLGQQHLSSYHCCVLTIVLKVAVHRELRRALAALRLVLFKPHAFHFQYHQMCVL
jgi:hypothetical protein